MAEFKIRMQRPLDSLYVEDLISGKVATLFRYFSRKFDCRKVKEQQEEDHQDCLMLKEANDNYNNIINMVSPELAKECK